MLFAIYILCFCMSVSAYTFVGCTDPFNFRPQANDPKGHYAGGTSAGCAKYCSSLHMPYFYNQYNTGQCYCSSAAPKASQYTYGASNLAGCEGDNYEIYALSGPANSLSFQGCYTGVTASLHPGNRFSSLEGCIKACSQSKSIMFSPNADTGAFDCKCDSRSSIGEMAADTTTCGQFTWFTYLNNQPKRRIEGKRRLDKQLVFDDDEEDCEGDEHETVHLVEEVKYVFVGEGCDDDEQSDAS